MHLRFNCAKIRIMSNLVERIRIALEKQGLSARAASLRAGLSHRFVSDLLDGSKKSLSVDNAEKLARVLDCSPEWLSFGRGEQEDTSDSDLDKVVNIWSRLLESDRHQIADMAEFLDKRKSEGE